MRLLICLLFLGFAARAQDINAHGAGVLFHNGVYYLYGEIKKGKTWLVPGQTWEDYRVPAGGVSCYSWQKKRPAGF